MFKIGSNNLVEAQVFNDRNGVLIGLKEDYSNLITDGVKHIKATFGVDYELKPTKPAIINQNTSFIGVVDKIKDAPDVEDAINKILRSKKALYSIMQATYLVCSLNGYFNLEKCNWEENTRVTFYTPKSLVRLADLVGGEEPNKKGVICEMLSDKSGLNVVAVNSSYLMNATATVLDNIGDIIGTRESFLKGRLGLE